jgi:hypothetical protein
VNRVSSSFEIALIFEFVPKPNPKIHMKKMLILAAAAAFTSASANAAFILTADNDGTTQPPSSRVYGTVFTTNATRNLDKFAIYDYSGNEGAGWTSANQKIVALYSLSGSTYTQINSTTLLTGAGTVNNALISGQNLIEQTFGGPVTLTAGTYFIAFSEVKPAGQVNYDGFVVTDNVAQNPASAALGVTWSSFGRLATSFVSAPASFQTTDLSTTFNAVGVIPSLVEVPEAGSSVMALALGAMVVRFRSRRA